MSDFDSVLQLAEAGDLIPEHLIISLLMKMMEVLSKENNIVEINGSVNVCGDIHGQLFDLLELFKATNFDINNMGVYLFLGDYVDRGRFSIETFAYLSVLKIKFPTKIFLLRGNHESRQVNQMYGFYNQSITNYGHSGVWSLANEVFDFLPMAALVNDNVFCVHGGLSPKISLIESLSVLNRRKELPSRGPLADICWSDPENILEWHENQRGAGYLFGKPQVDAFCHNNKLEFVARSHQIVDEGFKWYFDNKLCTVWSAPNYMYRFNNKASVLRVENNGYEILYFNECPDELRRIPDDLPLHWFFS